MKLFAPRFGVVPVALLATGIWLWPQVSRASPTDPTAFVTGAKTLDHALDADLIAAVTKANLEGVRGLLSRGADPNAKDPGFLKGTALTAASTYYGGNVNIVQALVEAGANLESQAGDGQTPLSLAVMGGHAELITYLAKAGANLETNSFHDTTPLMSAVFLSNAELVRALVAAGANVNTRASAHQTALFVACQNTVAGRASLEIVKTLVEAGADVSVKTTNGKTASQIAGDNGLREIKTYLNDVSNRDGALWNAAAQAGNRMAGGPFLNAWNDVRAALDRGATGHFTADNTDGQGSTALHFLAFATQNFDEATAKRVLVVSDINAQDRRGYTGLHYAAGEGNEKMAALLIAAGAAVSPLESKGSTPLDFTNQTRYPHLYAMLREAGAKSAAELKAPVVLPADPLAQNSIGDTTLMLLAVKKPFDAAQAAALLKAGVKINEHNIGGWTALSNACHAASPDAVRFLLKNGADVNYALDFFGKGDTALMDTAQLPDSDAVLDIVRQLIAAGAAVNAKGNGNKTALNYARASANQRVIDALLKAGALEN